MGQNTKKFLIVGSGGRESAFAVALAKDSIVYAVIDHPNPTIVTQTLQSGGDFLIGPTSNPETILNYAKAIKPDFVFISSDLPLAKGVIDALLTHGIVAIGGTKAATRIEWDKIYAMEMMQQYCPQWTPFYQVIHSIDQLPAAIQLFAEKQLPLVVKPQGLTGGKGVRVMPEHLANYQESLEYATQLLTGCPDEKIVLVEKLEGLEFTIMGITDGINLALAPASYDYPFRFENDVGEGTGGMGCLCYTDKKLPFLNNKDWEDCRHIMQTIVNTISRNQPPFKGILNGGFFKTTQGIRFMEFNSRFGDPEAINILSVLKTPFSVLLQQMWAQTINENELFFHHKKSVVKYLVAKEYPHPSPDYTRFTLDAKAINAMGIEILFASCIEEEQGIYRSLKKSRVLALSCLDDHFENASEKINSAISKHIQGSLEYRSDIGKTHNLKKLEETAMRLKLGWEWH